MILPEIYLLTSDMRCYKGAVLSKFMFGEQYERHNCLSYNNITPLIGSPSYFPVVEDIGRWGRYLIIKLNTGTILFRMSYKTSIIRTTNPYPILRGGDSKFIGAAMRMICAGRDEYLIYMDPMSCGNITVYGDGYAPDEFSYLGMDIFDSYFTEDYLYEETRRYLCIEDKSKKLPVKSFLMNNSVIAWLDNEFASEALFISGVSPHYDVRDLLSREQVANITKSITHVYSNALEYAQGIHGEVFPIESLYLIYNNTKKCIACGTQISMSLIDGRKTFWCGKCQKDKRTCSIL